MDKKSPKLTLRNLKTAPNVNKIFRNFYYSDNMYPNNRSYKLQYLLVAASIFTDKFSSLLLFRYAHDSSFDIH